MIVREREQIELDIKNNPLNGDFYFEYGLCLEEYNLKQAYISFENAIFLGCNPDNAKSAYEHMERLAAHGGFVPPCSIVILSYNQREYTQKCIESIRETTPKSAREIVIVDNASKDDSLEYLRQQSDIVLVANDFNAGFPSGCNIGIRASKKENDIFLLNNDTVMCANSLFWLRMGLYESEDFGAVGAVSMSDLNFQSAIEEGFDLGQYQEFALKNNVPMENPYEFRVFLIGYAVLIRRELLEKIGYLDEQFGLGNCEDVELGVRILQYGKQNVLVHNSFLIHWGGKSFNNAENVDRNSLIITNYQKLVDKYGFSDYEMYTMYPNDSQQVESAICNSNVGDHGSVLIVGCGMGSSLPHYGWVHPTFEMYGLEKGSICSKITSHLKGCNIAEYTSIDTNPFKGKQFDLILIDMSIRKNSELLLYVDVLSEMLKTTGVLYVIANNMSFYGNWLPIMKKECIPERINDSDIIWESDIYDPIKSHGFNPAKWIFFFESSVSDEGKKLAEQINNQGILAEKIAVVFKR